MSGAGDNWTSAQRRSQRTTRSAAQGGQDFSEEIDENLMTTDPNSQAQRWESKKYAQRTHIDDQAEAGGMGSSGTQNLQGGQGMRGVEGSRTTGGGMGGMHDEGRTEAYPSASSQGRYQSARATDDPGEGVSGMSGKSQGYGDQGYGSHAGRTQPPENQETGGVLGSLGDKVKGAMGDVSKKAAKFSGEQ
ncbi:uncharacterized protein GIQ15_04765 [Arthroderma uncinatum]|uniref:uncharacterized protein n=1 Tax=Arthroderma uncinatum TaxID=74035 RepID=UPI00144A9DDE|nr:uncharacterized protein GIQ15_04765 [Arthroderma uncinatum]KAF3482006.1 hypothetical protein GIQ15_04765 [Arthroderma uncinatum]